MTSVTNYHGKSHVEINGEIPTSWGSPPLVCMSGCELEGLHVSLGLGLVRYSKIKSGMVTLCL